MTAPLAGVRVVDLTNVLAGPFCGFQLALLGADVVKVEPPGRGDLARELGSDPALNANLMGSSFLAQNAGKRSIAIDLKHKDGKAAFERLAATADVVLENYRPGVMDRLGIGYARLKTLKPDLVYCALSGYGQQGPLRDNPAYDQIVQGMSGAMSVTGDAASAPLRAGYPISDTVGGYAAALAIAACLFGRKTTGEGRFIDVAMLDAMLAALGWAVSNWTIAGVPPGPVGNDNVTSAPSGAFRARDGLLNIAANKQEQFDALCRAIGRADLLTDPRFATRNDRIRHRNELTEAIEAALGARSAADWEPTLNAVGVPAGRVLTVPEAVAHPQVAARGVFQVFENVPGASRPVPVATGGARISGGNPSVSRPPPTLGQHTDEILGELGYDATAIAALRKSGAV